MLLEDRIAKLCSRHKNKLLSSLAKVQDLPLDTTNIISVEFARLKDDIIKALENPETWQGRNA